MIGELGEKQAAIKEMINDNRDELPGSPNWLAGNSGHDDDAIVAVVMTRMEMVSPARDFELIDLIWAGEFLDHMDTQGFKMVRK